MPFHLQFRNFRDDQFKAAPIDLKLTYVNLKLPSTDCLICQDLSEGDGETISEKPLARFTLDIQSCKEVEK
jgi:hypothetical protein